MQSAVKTVSDLELEINIVVPANELQVAYGNKINEVASKAKVDGFRAGKVPVSYVKKIYGKSIESEVVDELVRTSFSKVCQDKAITVAGIEKVDVIQKEIGKDLEFTINVETYPEIKFDDSDFSGTKVEKFETEVADKDVDDAIERLRKSHANWETVGANAKAKLEDKVILDFTAVQDGKNLESGAANDFDLVLGSKHLIPGFEEGIVGHKAGDEFELDLTFPEDYHSEEQAGKQAIFTVKLKEIQRPVLPEIDQEFCSKFGVTIQEPVLDAESDEDSKDKAEAKKNKPADPKALLEALKEKVKTSLSAEVKNQIESKYKNAMFDSLCDKKEVKVPKALIEEEITNLINQQQERYRSYIGNKHASLDLPRSEFAEQAEKNVHLRLLVRAFIQQFEIKADRDVIKAKLSEAMGGHEISDDLLNWYYSEPQRLGQIEALALEDLVTKKLEEKFEVVNKKITVKELMEPAQA